MDSVHFEFPQRMTITDSMWDDANDWNDKSIGTIIRVESPTITRSYIPSSETLTMNNLLTQAQVENYDGMIAENFDNFIALMNSIWVLRFNSEDWYLSTCTCPSWVRYGLCKHVIGTAVAMGQLQCPPNKFSKKLKMPKDRRPRAL